MKNIGKPSRRLQFDGESKIAIKLLTERKQLSRIRMTDAKGNVVEIPPPLPKKLIPFLEANGIQISSGGNYLSRIRGRCEIVGVHVKVVPKNHTNYTGGIVVDVFEENELSTQNTNQVVAFLDKHGVDVARECKTWELIQKQGACVFQEVDANGQPVPASEL